MRRLALTLSTVLLAGLAAATPLRAQAGPDWRPANPEMPAMPTMAELQAGWQSSLAPWFGGLERAAGVGVQGLRATGTARGGAARAQVARLMNGPIPVVVMTDRNGDDRADLVEIFRDGSLVIQVIDADYNGRANVMRVYDAAGTLLREDKL